MRLLDRQIIRELVGPFLFGLATFSSVYFALGHMTRLTQALMSGMPFWQGAQVFLQYLPAIFVVTLPLATLLGVLMGVGRLSADSEVTALFAGGVSIYRIAVPIIALGILVTGVSIALNELVAPRAAASNQALMDAVLRQETRSDKPFILRDDSTQCVIHVGSMDADTGVLKDVTITKFMESQPLFTVFARRARWDGLKKGQSKLSWQLYDGWAAATDGSGRNTFAKSVTRDISKTPQELSLFQKKPEEMTFAELSSLVRHLKQNPDRAPEKIRRLDVDLWNKLGFPLSGLVFAMLAAPLAIRPTRSSSSVGLGLSVLLMFAYWVIWNYATQLAVQGNIEAPMGAFLADILGVIAAVVLLKRAAK